MTTSIILPALSPALLAEALDSLYRYAPAFEFEIVVVAPFGVRGPNLVHVPEQVQRGNCAAHALGAAAASGDILVAFTEDSLALPGWLDDVPETLAAREARHGLFLGGLHRPDVAYFGTVYGRYFPYFPLASRACLTRIGGWFDPDYRAHFGDSDMALRTYAQGGHCALLPGDRLFTNTKPLSQRVSTFKAQAMDQDFQRFLARHHGRFGDGFAAEMTDIHLDLPLDHLEDSAFTYAGPIWRYVDEGRRPGGRRLYRPKADVAPLDPRPYRIDA